MKTRLVCAALALVASMSPAQAGVQDFAVVNNTGYPIERLHVSASTKEAWEEDVLGQDILAEGARATIKFDSDDDNCLWDVKVVYSDGDAAAWHGLNLCEVSVVALRYDAETGRTWADTE